MDRPIRRALISVFHKEGLAPIVDRLNAHGVEILSTGGTQRAIEALGADVTPVESITHTAEMLGGRVKTLHPMVFGGILARRDFAPDDVDVADHGIGPIDLVIVDLYPFEETLASGAEEGEIIEKIDIGGIALIRAAAKNFRDVVCIPSRGQYADLLEALGNGMSTNLDFRRRMAGAAFGVSSGYDAAIGQWVREGGNAEVLSVLESTRTPLRYGENPHQPGAFFGDLAGLFTQHNGKALSYNNLLDVDAAVQLMTEFRDGAPTVAILKHNNACGLATRASLSTAYADALAGDPVSAFGGIVIANRPMDLETAEALHSLFCEVVIAPSFAPEALAVLSGKKNRILLEQRHWPEAHRMVRSALGGYLVQQPDGQVEGPADFSCATKAQPTPEQMEDLAFALKLAKHTRSNTIVLAKEGQLLASGTGQTSRVDALNQAVDKAERMGFDLHGAVMASDAFFPFPDCVEIAHNAGIVAVVQPGGSIKDAESISFCDAHGMAMVMTGVRHFRH
jgi:phosphoribosylaminoimidazolecarboxamide formyltransferase/IMP cyclohydrolase